jgi:hypothetical protein
MGRKENIQRIEELSRQAELGGGAVYSPAIPTLS